MGRSTRTEKIIAKSHKNGGAASTDDGSKQSLPADFARAVFCMPTPTPGRVDRRRSCAYAGLRNTLET